MEEPSVSDSDCRFPRCCRISHKRDYQAARNGGWRRHTSHFVIYVFKYENGPARLGITASRKVGGAVQRNYIKRLLREFFRQHRNRLADGQVISIVAKSGAGELGYAQVRDELLFLLFPDCQARRHD